MSENNEVTAILLLGHGSRASNANNAQFKVAEDLRQTYPIVVCAFLELSEPNIPAGLTLCHQAGATCIIVVPYFLALGIHVQKDLPEIIAQWLERHPEVEVRMANPLGYSPKMTEIVYERIKEQISQN